jgi:hypothetical protein
MPIFLPLSIWWAAKRGYKASADLSTAITYSFHPDSFNIQTKTAEAKLSWPVIVRVTKHKNWVLIWQNRQTANPIPHRAFAAGQLSQVKQLLASNQVKNNL